MMRQALGLIGLGFALVLAGCVSKERVTLLSPAKTDQSIGGIVIDYEDGQGYLGDTSQQVKLRGANAPHLVKQFDNADPFYTDLMRELPPTAVREYFYFGFGEKTLSPAEMDKLQSWLVQNIENRPGVHIEIAAHTDAVGTQEVNDRVSAQRAEVVVDQVNALIDAGKIDVEAADIEPLPGSFWWARSALKPGEVPRPNRAYRVVVVTVR
ncbi:MAG: OmpA family protein [Pseudomonadota bacterium]